MAVNNASYFNVARDWENQVKKLFVTSPAYLSKQNTVTYMKIQD